ncbi:MAG: GNAT family N-acetyltransferase [Rhodopila sp.]|nr:GNAT family N-acetyltransferase [Rhodopila sp.]
MSDEWILETARGPVVLRPEQSADGDFLYALFRSHALPGFAALPIDDAMKESLVRMQFTSQTATYRAQYPDARFLVLECDRTPIGRLVLHEGADAATIVDLALLPHTRGGGIGSAVLGGLVTTLRPRGTALRCTVLCTNEASLRMCRRAGFVPIRESPPHVELEWRP